MLVVAFFGKNGGQIERKKLHSCYLAHGQIRLLLAINLSTGAKGVESYSVVPKAKNQLLLRKRGRQLARPNRLHCRAT
jgi:hypothetical protein